MNTAPLISGRCRKTDCGLIGDETAVWKRRSLTRKIEPVTGIRYYRQTWELWYHRGFKPDVPGL